MTTFGASPAGSFAQSDVGSRLIGGGAPSIGELSLVIIIDEVGQTYDPPVHNWQNDLAPFLHVKQKLIDLGIWDTIGKLALIQMIPDSGVANPLITPGEEYPEDVLLDGAGGPPLLTRNPTLEELEAVLSLFGASKHELTMYIDNSGSMNTIDMEPGLDAFITARPPDQPLTILEPTNERWILWVAEFLETFLP